MSHDLHTSTKFDRQTNVMWPTEKLDFLTKVDGELMSCDLQTNTVSQLNLLGKLMSRDLYINSVSPLDLAEKLMSRDL